MTSEEWLSRFFCSGVVAWQNEDTFLGNLLACARPERVQSLLTHLLLANHDSVKLPDAVFSQLLKRMRHASASEMLRQEEISRVVRELALAGLSPLLFKGTALAYSLYPQPYLRDRCDTDLLFAGRERAEAAWAVLRGLGYERMNAVDGELISYQFPCTLKRGGLTEMLDVHWATSNATQLRRFSFEELRDSAITVPELGPGALAPCHEHALVLACLHRLGHMIDGDQNKLIWLYDIHLLLNSLDENQWQRFAQCVRDKGLAGACLDGIEMAEQVFGGCANMQRLDDIRELAECPDQQLRHHGSVLARDLAQLHQTSGLGQRCRLLMQHLFPSRDYMLQKYQPRWTWLLPYYYLRRIVSGGGRRFRDHWVARRQ